MLVTVKKDSFAFLSISKSKSSVACSCLNTQVTVFIVEFEVQLFMISLHERPCKSYKLLNYFQFAFALAVIGHSLLSFEHQKYC